MKYRPEIDGLRALAVVPVIFFHAGFELFSGGFVGVDVFFVISGYLITTILVNDIEKGRFSIVTFYERRARRILPALFFVMLCCFPFAWLWMLPGHLEEFSRSVVAVSLFSSNILFWRESGYFDLDAEEKPLLHTWSLAVEEQYYLLFPLMLVLIWRFGKRPAFWILVVAAAFSLLLSEWGWRNSAMANFYLAPTRAWELFAGSIAAFIVQKYGVSKNNLLSAAGISAILFSVFIFDENTPFPSVYALLPVGGVVLLILFAERQTIVAKLLSLRLFVGIGLVSYSAYLWHQPLMAFARIRLFAEPSDGLMLALSVASILLAVFSWRYVEQPFRGRHSLMKDRAKLFVFSALGLTSFMAVGLVGAFNDGFPERFDFSVDQTEWADNDKCTVYYGQFESKSRNLSKRCFSDEEKPDFILMGDSHAASISKELRKAIEAKGGELITLLENGCFLVPGTAREPEEPSCISAKEDYWRFAQKTDATIILLSRWRLNFMGTRFDNEEGGVEKGESGQNFVIGNTDSDLFLHSKQQLGQLSQFNKIIVLSQVPEAGWSVPSQLFKMHLNGANSFEIDTRYDVYKEKNREVNNWLEEISDFENISIVYLDPLVCSNTDNRCKNVENGYSLYRDDDHPSNRFAEKIARLVLTTAL